MTDKHHIGPHPRGNPPKGGRTDWMARLGLNSIRTRYLGVAFLFVVFLLGAAWIAETQVNKATNRGLDNTLERHQIRKTLRALSDDIWLAGNSLQGYMLVPSAEKNREVKRRLDQALKRTALLSENAWIKQTPTTREHAQNLAQHLAQLDREAQRVMVIRADNEKLYPAMPTMLEKMLPANMEFTTAATLAMDEAAEELNNPKQIEVYRLFSESRYAFNQMIAAFRSWLANRLGVFGEPEIAMRAQAGNIALYAETVNLYLKKLSDLDKQGQLGLQQTDSIKKMQAANQTWHKYYKKVYAINTSERWRADTPLLRDTILPHFAKSWEILRALDKELDIYSAEDMEVLTATADQMSKAIWLLTLIGILVTGSGFLLFEYTVRRPIARVAHALKAEATGVGGITVPETHTEETRDLITAFDSMRQQVHSRQQRLKTILNNAAEGIITFDHWGIIESFNQAAEKLFGWEEKEVIGTSIGLLIAPDRREKRKGYLEHFLRYEIKRLIGHEGEVVGRHRDGTTFPMALKISVITLNGKQLYTALVADISERKAMMDHLKSMAEHDGLTGMYNRSYFQQELERVVERVRRSGDHCCALLYIDLDNFKYVNDTLGHAAGDRLLIEVARTLRRRARKSDLIARFGGDEFTVLLYDTTPALAERVAESFRARLADYEFKHTGEKIHIGCSIGVNPLGPNTKSAEEALSQADLACHLAKRGGRNRVHMFNPADAEKVATMSLDMGWSRRIKEAIDKNRFALACQPIVNVQTREIESYEVLIRMLDGNDELIMPAGFLPAAERFGLSVDIDKWVIINAVETLAEQRKRFPELCYSINLSAKTLADHSAYGLVEYKLKEVGLDPAALTFEVTETDAISDMAVAETFLSKLQALGCKTALDDFGSGMSSFAYLKDLPVDIVKIDGRFVKNLASNPVDQTMVKAMNDIAHALGKQTIAEFVENEESFRLLVEFGVDYGQGYHLGRPDVTLPCKAIADRAGNAGICKI